jgi:hypothetical protein
MDKTIKHPRYYDARTGKPNMPDDSLCAFQRVLSPWLALAHAEGSEFDTFEGLYEVGVEFQAMKGSIKEWIKEERGGSAAT